MNVNNKSIYYINEMSERMPTLIKIPHVSYRYNA